MGEQGPGRVDDAYRAAVIDMERVFAGGREKTAEVDEPLGRGAGIAVDGLVVVAHPEHGALGTRQQPYQQQMGRSEVLELVHQQGAGTMPCRRAGGRVGEQDLDRPVDLLVEIDQAAVRQEATVTVEHLGEAVHVAGELGLHVGRGLKPEAHRGEGFDPGHGRVGVGPAGQVDQAVQDAAHLALVDGGHRGQTWSAWTGPGS